MKRIYAVLLTAAALAGLPQAMRAQQLPPPPPANWILDNFKIGAGGVSSRSGVKTVTLPSNPNTDSELIGGAGTLFSTPLKTLTTNSLRWRSGPARVQAFRHHSSGRSALGPLPPWTWSMATTLAR
jgi:hypothetical protein